MENKADTEWHAYVTAKLKEGDQRMNELATEMNEVKAQLVENTQATTRVEANTSEMLDVFLSWRGAMKVIEMTGRLARPLAYILTLFAAFVGFWAALKSGVGK